MRDEMQVVTVKMDSEMIEKLDELARRMKITRSTLIRWAIEDMINKYSAIISEEEEKLKVKVIKLRV